MIESLSQVPSVPANHDTKSALNALKLWRVEIAPVDGKLKLSQLTKYTDVCRGTSKRNVKLLQKGLAEIGWNDQHKIMMMVVAPLVAGGLYRVFDGNSKHLLFAPALELGSARHPSGPWTQV